MQNIDQNRKCWCNSNTEMENNKFKEISTKNRTCYYLNDMIKFKDFDFGNIVLDKKVTQKIF